MFFRGFPAGTENSTVDRLNLKEFSNGITAPFKRGWQAGDKRNINECGARRRKPCAPSRPQALTNNGTKEARAGRGNAPREIRGALLVSPQAASEDSPREILRSKWDFHTSNLARE
jgi:hypothetical protein